MTFVTVSFVKRRKGCWPSLNRTQNPGLESPRLFSYTMTNQTCVACSQKDIPPWQLAIFPHMSCPTRKPTMWTLRKVSTRFSLSMPCRLTRTDTFRILWIVCFKSHYSIPVSRVITLYLYPPETECVRPD